MFQFQCKEQTMKKIIEQMKKLAKVLCKQTKPKISFHFQILFLDLISYVLAHA